MEIGYRVIQKWPLHFEFILEKRGQKRIIDAGKGSPSLKNAGSIWALPK